MDLLCSGRLGKGAATLASERARSVNGFASAVAGPSGYVVSWSESPSFEKARRLGIGYWLHVA